MKRFAIVTATAAIGAVALFTTGCQNGGAHAEADVNRPAMEAAARGNSVAYVATKDSHYVYTPTDTTNGGTLHAGDVVYFDNNTAVGNGRANETGFETTSENGQWRMARTADGRTVFVHPEDFRPR